MPRTGKSTKEMGAGKWNGDTINVVKMCFNYVMLWWFGKVCIMIYLHNYIS